MTPNELVEKVVDAMLQEDNYYVSRDHARAAIRVVLEEAAKVADVVEDEPFYAYGTYQSNIATAIRALMPKEQT
jgi:hypothetical protein